MAHVTPGKADRCVPVGWRHRRRAIGQCFGECIQRGDGCAELVQQHLKALLLVLVGAQEAGAQIALLLGCRVLRFGFDHGAHPRSMLAFRKNREPAGEHRDEHQVERPPRTQHGAGEDCARIGRRTERHRDVACAHDCGQNQTLTETQPRGRGDDHQDQHHDHRAGGSTGQPDEGQRHRRVDRGHHPRIPGAAHFELGPGHQQPGIRQRKAEDDGGCERVEPHPVGAHRHQHDDGHHDGDAHCDHDPRKTVSVASRHDHGSEAMRGTHRPTLGTDTAPVWNSSNTGATSD